MRTRTHRTLTLQKPLRPQTPAWIGSSRGADHGRDGALQRVDDLAHPDLRGVADELVAAAGAARAGDEAGLAQADHELLQVGPGQVLVVGHLGQADGSVPVVAGQLHHQADAVLAAGREVEGAGRGEGRSHGDGVAPGLVVGAAAVPVEFRLFPSGLSLDRCATGVNGRAGGGGQRRRAGGRSEPPTDQHAPGAVGGGAAAPIALLGRASPRKVRTIDRSAGCRARSRRLACSDARARSILLTSCARHGRSPPWAASGV